MTYTVKTKRFSPCFPKDPGNEIGRLKPVLIVMQVSG